MNYKIISALIITKSPVNTLLRNPLRVLNHMELIDDKLSIGSKYDLLSSGDNSKRFETNMQILDALQRYDINIQETLAELVRTSRGTSLEEFKQRLMRAYTTGVLEFHITDKCDLDCIECHYRDKSNETIPFGYIAPLLSRLQPKAIIVTGGGEPNVYQNEGKNLNDVICEIKRILPKVSLGLINNNTRLVKGPWTKYINWQRSSLDCSNAETYLLLKRRPRYDAVVSNVKELLLKTDIPYVGVGFLYRRENISEISDFLKGWFEWTVTQSEAVKKKFNIQFRPIAPGIDNVAMIRAGLCSLVPEETQGKLEQQVAEVLNAAKKEKNYANFLDFNTNFQTLAGKSLNRLHDIQPFNKCFNALAHRVQRATGEEYQDFLLCNNPELSLGNPLKNGDMDIFRVALLEYYYFNKRGPFCNDASCRQGWVSNTVERYKSGQLQKESSLDDYFF
ncbi:MAG: hypothetical protein PHV30_08005 [Candidatus Margulisbacteria bacterium]|nr:hypothetical protein [Candidatus Margulisiibacteriota bacterium]